MSLANPTITDTAETIIQPGRYSFILIENPSDTDVEICFGAGDLDTLDGIKIPAGDHRLFTNDPKTGGPFGNHGVKAVHREAAASKDIVVNSEPLP